MMNYWNVSFHDSVDRQFSFAMASLSFITNYTVNAGYFSPVNEGADKFVNKH